MSPRALRKEHAPAPEVIEVGDVVRVAGWPNTAKRLFEVKEIEPYDGPTVRGQSKRVPTVHAYEIEKGGTRGKLRSFPLDACTKRGNGDARVPVVRKTS